MDSDAASRKRKNKKQKETEVQIGNLNNPPASSLDITGKGDTSKVKRVDRYDSLWFVVGIVFVASTATLAWEVTHYVPTLTSPVSYRISNRPLSQTGSYEVLFHFHI